MDFAKFIDEGFISQQKYANKIGEMGPDTLLRFEQDSENPMPDDVLAHRYRKMIEHFGHMTEEMIEARVYVPRRSWKNGERSYLDSDKLRREFIAVMYDILLFFRAILAYGGISGSEFVRIALEKEAYNQVRPDHNVNGREVVSSSPSEELSGNCASASF